MQEKFVPALTTGLPGMRIRIGLALLVDIVRRLTYSMGQSPSGEANRFSSSQKIRRI